MVTGEGGSQFGRGEGRVRSEMSPNSSTVCDKVYWDFATCLRYLAGYESDPIPYCCKSIAELSSEAMEYKEAEAICQCIETLAMGTDIRFVVSRVEDLPEKCHTPVTFPISNSMNCSK
ncbi:unnamed protein product [Lupinus luteus]|uniref:Bifunctional inhibitor/plant lipid transfer protein/seed storage helical domain-containing protein n=1 Tax=Lupinus luteus TaxID=3873 RepID=A0AAV1XP13_LUPLU